MLFLHHGIDETGLDPQSVFFWQKDAGRASYKCYIEKHTQRFWLFL